MMAVGKSTERSQQRINTFAYANQFRRLRESPKFYVHQDASLLGQYTKELAGHCRNCIAMFSSPPMAKPLLSCCLGKREVEELRLQAMSIATKDKQDNVSPWQFVSAIRSSAEVMKALSVFRGLQWIRDGCVCVQPRD